MAEPAAFTRPPFCRDIAYSCFFRKWSSDSYNLSYFVMYGKSRNLKKVKSSPLRRKVVYVIIFLIRESFVDFFCVNEE